MFFVLLFFSVALSFALGEIVLSWVHAKKIEGKKGASEFGRLIYLALAVLYPVTLLATPIESAARGYPLLPAFVTVFFLSKLLKVWVIISLKGNWIMRTMKWDGQEIVTEGPYRFLRHPNYLVMAFEIPSYCLAGSAWMTALVTTPFYIYLLSKRVRLENMLLHGDTDDTR